MCRSIQRLSVSEKQTNANTETEALLKKSSGTGQSAMAVIEMSGKSKASKRSKIFLLLTRLKAAIIEMKQCSSEPI